MRWVEVSFAEKKAKGLPVASGQLLKDGTDVGIGGISGEGQLG